MTDNPRSNNNILDQIDRDYARLIERVDRQIESLTRMERELDEQLRGRGDVEVHDESTDDTSSIDDDEDEVAQMMVNLRMPHVRFDPRVQSINDNEISPLSPLSESTVRQNFTPFDYIVDSEYDSDSDTDTLVPDWEDPSRSPDLRFITMPNDSTSSFETEYTFVVDDLDNVHVMQDHF